jgi:hypothetical protein
MLQENKKDAYGTESPVYSVEISGYGEACFLLFEL